MAEPKVNQMFQSTIAQALEIENKMTETGKTKTEVLREAIAKGLPLVEKKLPL